MSTYFVALGHEVEVEAGTLADLWIELPDTWKLGSERTAEDLRTWLDHPKGRIDEPMFRMKLGRSEIIHCPLVWIPTRKGRAPLEEGPSPLGPMHRLSVDRDTSMLCRIEGQRNGVHVVAENPMPAPFHETARVWFQEA